MAKHDIKLKITKGIDILNADIVIAVKQNETTLGTLTLSRGSIDWRPKKKRSGGKNETQLSWGQFDEVMQQARKE